MNHNFAANYHSANGAGDEKMKEDMIMSEIAKLIVHHPHRVVEHLRKAGMKIKNNPSRSALVAATTEALHNSPRVAHEMMLDITTGRHKHRKHGHGFDGGHWAMTGADKRKCTNAGGVMVMNQATGQYECSKGGGAMGDKHQHFRHRADGQAVNFSRYYGVDHEVEHDGGAVDKKKKGVNLDDVLNDVNKVGDAYNKNKDAIDSTKNLVKNVGHVFGGKKKHKAKAATNPQESDQLMQEAIDQKDSAQQALTKKVDAVAAGSGMHSHTKRNIAIGVGVAVAVGLGFTWWHFAHKAA